MRRRVDLGMILVIGMGLALVPGFFTSEITIGGWTFRSDRLIVGYAAIAMSVIAVAAALRGRQLVVEAHSQRQYGRAASLTLTFGAAVLFCCAVVWYVVLFWMRT